MIGTDPGSPVPVRFGSDGGRRKDRALDLALTSVAVNIPPRSMGHGVRLNRKSVPVPFLVVESREQIVDRCFDMCVFRRRFHLI